MPTARTKSSAAAKSAEAPRWRRMWLRRAAWLAIAIAAGVGGWSWACRTLAVHQLRQRNYEAAELWLNRSQMCRWRTGGDHFWRARLDRQLLQPDRTEAELVQAEQRGFDPTRIRKERLLLQAQAGRLTGIMSDLERWLLNPDDDGAELCEAFTNGLLINHLTNDAEAVVKAWKQEYPQDPQPYVTWGRWLESQQLIVPAEDEYQQALHRRTHFAPALYALGRLQLNRGADLQKARGLFAQAAETLRAAAAPQIGAARCLHQLGETAAARGILENVVAQGEPAIRRSFALVQDPDPSLPGERLLSEILTGLGEFERALPYLDRLLEREPRDPTLRYLRAQCLQGQQRDDEAQALFREVADDRAAIAEADRLVDEIRQHPGDPQIEARFRVGELFWKHDSNRKAEYWLRNTLALAPRHAGAHRLLAECYALRARFDSAMQAAADYHRALGDTNDARIPSP